MKNTFDRFMTYFVLIEKTLTWLTYHKDTKCISEIGLQQHFILIQARIHHCLTFFPNTSETNC